jgi:uncharacterized protein YndB with AHSA1/START domain
MARPVPLAVTVSRDIDAPAQRIYDLISDVTGIGRFSPETRSAGWLDGATGPAVGARFRGRNAIGLLRWSTVPTVTAAEPGRRFAFDVPAPSNSTWSYDLAPAPGGGTRVTESMRRSTPQPLILRVLQRLAGVTDRAEHLRAGMSATLAGLAAAAEVHDNAQDRPVRTAL